MAETITLDKGVVNAVLHYAAYEGWHVASHDWNSEWRWGNEWRLVIANEDDEYYATVYRDSVGDGNWHSWSDVEEVTFTRVYPREVMTIEYVEAE